MKIKKRYPKRILTITLVLAIILFPFDILASSASSQNSASEGEQTYVIQSSSDWDEFAQSVSSGANDYAGTTVLLDADIEVSASAGAHVHKNNFDFDGNAFKGVFNGQGHTLTMNISGDRCAALFPNAGDGAAFRNLRVEGSATGSSSHASGLVGSTKGTVTFQNIVVAADVTSSHCAGLVGHNYVSSLIFENCVFCGTLNASSQGCGFVGWGQSSSDHVDSISFTNCAAVGGLTGNGSYDPFGYTLDDSYLNVQIDNCNYNIDKEGSNNTKYNSGSAEQYRQVVAGIRKGGPTVENITENTAYYTTLNDAISNWSDGTTLVLFSDVSNDTTITVPSGEHTLDLNGYGIKMTGSGVVIKVGSGSTLNMNDSDTDATHKFDVPEGAGVATLNEASGTYTVKGGYITGGNEQLAGGVYILDNGTFNMYGGCIIGNKATVHGGGVDVSAPGTKTGIFNMYGGSICYNSAPWGGGINVFGTAYVNEGCTIHHNTASNGGGGIELESGGKLYLNGSTVTENVVLSQNGGMWKGGGVHVPNGTECHLQGAIQIKDNYRETFGTAQSNVFVRREVPGKVVLDSALTSNSSIGVGTNGDIPFTVTSAYGTYHGTTDPSKYFTSDNENYEVILNDSGEVELSEYSLFDGDGTEEEPYLIGSTDDWNTLADSVLGGNSYVDKYFKLTEDITVNRGIGGGLSSNNIVSPFGGTFDGGGHTLTVNIESSAVCAAPFFDVAGATTIKNLKVDGYVKGNGHPGGLVGSATGTLKIENVLVSADVSGSIVGGIIGHGFLSDIIMESCAYTGDLQASSWSGGFLAWGGPWGEIKFRNNCTLSINNCLFAGSRSDSKNFHPIGFADGGGSCCNILSNSNTWSTLNANTTSSIPNGDTSFRLTAATVTNISELTARPWMGYYDVITYPPVEGSYNDG